MIRTPAVLFGPVFSAVQEAALFRDSKSFADAVPRHDVEQILAEWSASFVSGREDLLTFVHRNFELPAEGHEGLSGTAPLAEHIASLWPVLTRRQESSAAGSSEIAMPRPFVVPGGRFRELYYWDAYFTSLGLIRSGRQDLVEDVITNFGSLLDRYGHIPNGTRTYYLSRSHPPVFYLLAELSRDTSEEARRRRLEWMQIEYRFWMDGAERLLPGEEWRRVVRLPDGSLLNRYWDDADGPREESWREDVTLAAGMSPQSSRTLWRNLRAAAESGWDFSSRWLDDGRTLASIRTTRLAPIDLNCLLYGLEQAIARNAEALGERNTAGLFDDHARARCAAINTRLWNDAKGFFADYDLDERRVRDEITAASVFALFTRMCDPARANRLGNAIRSLLRRGGLLTAGNETGQQWDAPNGWAPLQWVAVAGLRHYDLTDLAETISARWIAMVSDHYRLTGVLLEKYDVERCFAGGGGEYATETGFGWTNGVTLELMEHQTPALT